MLDRFLNSISMYRLMLYYLIALLLGAVLESYFGLISFDHLALLLSILTYTAVSLLVNYLWAKTLKVQTNPESSYITALILVLITTPSKNPESLLLYAITAAIAMSSKYILAINKKHIFNPAAVAVFIAYLIFKQGASWWIGQAPMLPLIILGGILVVKKISRIEMLVSFLILSSVTLLFYTHHIDQILLSIQWFLAFVMLIEPLTSPTKKRDQIIYGGLVGFLTSSNLNFGPLFLSPEVSLLLGNIFSYLFSQKRRFILTLKNKRNLARDVIEFSFQSDHKINFKPGQYLEWTLAHKSDTRGARRFFTIASSPEENQIKSVIRFSPNPSSFKRTLEEAKVGQQIMVSVVAGEFTLPDDKDQKLALLAGGIGVTPFISMVKHLINTGEKRDIVLIYSNKTGAEIVEKDFWKKAQKLGVRVVFVLTEKGTRIDEGLIKKEIPDFKKRIFYISGPLSMISAFKKALKKMGVRKIMTDYFPGYSS